MAAFPSSVYSFIFGSTNYSMLFDNDINGNQQYIGWAQPGSLSSDSQWRIMHQTFDSNSNVLTITWPNASTAFGFVWDNRSTYVYS